MASIAADKLPQAEKDQLAVCYAAFVLEGSGAAVTADSLRAVIKASGLNVNDTLVGAVAKALKNRKVTDFFGAVGGAPAAGTPAPVAEKAAEKKADKPKEAAKPAPPPPAAEEEEMDMGGLFD